MEIAEVKPIIVSQDLSQCMSGGTWAYSNRTVCLVKIITRSPKNKMKSLTKKQKIKIKILFEFEFDIFF